MAKLLAKVVTVVVCVSLQATSAFKLPDFEHLDTDKNADILVGEFKIGATYVENLVLNQTTTFDGEGMKMEQKMQMIKEEQTFVSEAPDGLIKLEMTPTRLAMSMNMMGNLISFDSASPHESSRNEMFDSLKGLVDHTTVILIKRNGTIVQASEHEEFLKKLNDGNVDNLKQFSPNQSLEERNRVLSMLPQKAVKPGDRWDYDADMGDMMHSSGTGILKGYTNFDGHPCAFISLQGSFEMDLEKFADVMDEDASGKGKLMSTVMKGVEIKDGKQFIFVLWDNEAKMARSTWIKQTMTVEMPNPLGDGFLDVPTEQLIVRNVDIKFE